jgi:hypothetical protein
VIVATVTMSMHAAPAEAQAAPVRSGLILTAYLGPTAPSPCSLIPDCAAWLASNCDERLAGLDPAVSTSIVDVSDLAGSTRLFVRHMWLANTSQLWSSDCWSMGHVPWRDTYISIPPGARWLTIPASAVPYQQWELW